MKKDALRLARIIVGLVLLVIGVRLFDDFSNEVLAPLFAGIGAYVVAPLADAAFYAFAFVYVLAEMTAKFLGRHVWPWAQPMLAAFGIYCLVQKLFEHLDRKKRERF